MQHVIVVDVHQNGGRLADDQRHPDGCVAIVSSQESAHEIGEWDLKQEVEYEMRNGSILFDVYNKTINFVISFVKSLQHFIHGGSNVNEEKITPRFLHFFLKLKYRTTEMFGQPYGADEEN